MKGSVDMFSHHESQVDKLQMTDCFRNGDFVRAQVLALGDHRSYVRSLRALWHEARGADDGSLRPPRGLTLRA